MKFKYKLLIQNILKMR